MQIVPEAQNDFVRQVGQSTHQTGYEGRTACDDLSQIRGDFAAQAEKDVGILTQDPGEAHGRFLARRSLFAVFDQTEIGWVDPSLPGDSAEGVFPLFFWY